MAKAGRKKEQGAEGQATEKKILEAARRVFHRHGFAGARMQEIADEADINKALLHYYFRNKEQLFAQVFREAIEQSIPAITQILASEAPLEEKIETFVHGYIDMLTQHPYIPAFVLHEINTAPERFMKTLPIGNTQFNIPGILIEQLERAISEGRIRPIAPRQLVANLVSLCVFPFAARPLLQMALHIPGEENFAAFIQERKATLVPFILNALRP